MPWARGLPRRPGELGRHGAPRFPAAGPGGTVIQVPGDGAALGPQRQRSPGRQVFVGEGGREGSREVLGGPRGGCRPAQGKGLSPSTAAAAEMLGSLVVCLCPKNISTSSRTLCPPPDLSESAPGPATTGYWAHGNWARHTNAGTILRTPGQSSLLS